MTRLELVMSGWNRLGAGFAVPAADSTPDVERLICETAAVLSRSLRLYETVLAWLVAYEKLVCSHRLAVLAGELEEDEPSAALGYLLTAAGVLGDTRHYRAAARACRPLSVPQPLFASQAKSAALRNQAQTAASQEALAWGLWASEAAVGAQLVRSGAWIVEDNPQLRYCAMFGGRLPASVLVTLRLEPQAGASESALARKLGVTRVALRDALDHLELCLLAERRQTGRNVAIRLRPL